MARVFVLVVALLAWVQTVAHAQTPPVWPASFVSRLEVLALMQSLNAENHEWPGDSPWLE